MTNDNQGLRRWQKAALVALILAGLLAFGLYLYSRDYYKPDTVAQAARELAETEGLLRETEDYIAIGDPSQAEMGYVFYPGGKVDPGAYIPYLLELYSYEGLFCAVVKAPLRLPILNVDGADAVQRDYPGVESWAVGGHSLGGVAAGRYAAKHDDLAGLALLASYPDVDLSGCPFPVLSVTAGQDKIVDWGKYESSLSNFPADSIEYNLPNGNHSQFGSYGHQQGDGRAGTSATSQRETVVAVTGAFLRGEMRQGM